jgi:hypothetical protein
VDCSDIWFSRHAIRRLFSRGIAVSDVLRAAQDGDVIEHYPDDEPWPESVVLGETTDGPIHVVIGREPETKRCVIITVYWPDHERWHDEFRRRRS